MGKNGQCHEKLHYGMGESHSINTVKVEIWVILVAGHV